MLTKSTVCQYGFLRWFSGKQSPCQCRRCRFYPQIRKIPWSRKWQPLHYLAWKIPCTEESGGLQSIGSQRVGHYWSANTCKPVMVENRVGVRCLSINCWASYSISNILQFRSSAHFFGEWLGSGLNAMNPDLRGCILSGALPATIYSQINSHYYFQLMSLLQQPLRAIILYWMASLSIFPITKVLTN